MVRDFQCVIGEETRAQMLEAEGRLPDSLVACIGGGSNAIGLFHPVPRRRERRDLRRRGGGARARRARRPRGLARGRPARRAARQPHLSADERRRPDQRGPFDLGRPRLSRHRPRACLAEGERPRHLSLGDRQGGARRVPALLAARRHHPGARAGPCAGQGRPNSRRRCRATT